MKIRNKKADTVLAKINGRATTWTVDSNYLSVLAHYAEKELKAKGVSSKNLIGVSVRFIPAGPRTKKYKYPVRSTNVTITRFPSGWFLTEALPCVIYPRSAVVRKVSIPRQAADDILSRYSVQE